MKRFLFVVCALLSLSLFSGCITFPFGPQASDPGNNGFYDINTVKGRVVTENVSAVRMSRPEDAIFVYRADNNKVIIGYNKAKSKPKYLDQISGGVVITPDGANRLTTFLENVVSNYDNTEKVSSEYMDFQFLINEEIVQALSEGPVEEEYISVRFQYIFNISDEKNEEITLCYMRGASSQPKKITYDDIKSLIDNLKKN